MFLSKDSLVTKQARKETVDPQPSATEVKKKRHHGERMHHSHQVFGALIMGFGLWVLFDNQSFIAVLQESSHTVKVASYILIAVGSLSMAMGFFGCIGAIYEIRCLLGLYFTCLLLILIAQVTAGVLIYFQREPLKYEMADILKGMIINYTGQNRTTEHTWDYVQRTMNCCGWTGPGNWSENLLIKNNSQNLYPCSCRNESLPGTDLRDVGMCEHLSPETPVYQTGCATSVEKWLLDNCGVILGICVGVAVIELLGMILSMCLCKSVIQEDYTKVPKGTVGHGDERETEGVGGCVVDALKD
ncbi:hypothetical protein F7725_023052 [Dissostichus mawsoni]|uniref:Tetraspanin n=1 Tax=Dissostichus mawsoni TaxID=36200 RepID=A0A7J5Z2I1_DISMA|nr:hypothetical protein F7725_023052 [Dissostichus mawsoni]